MKRLVCLDFEGVIYSGDAPCDGVTEFVNAMRESGCDVVVLSNTTRLSSEELAKRIEHLNLPIIDGFSMAAAAFKNEKLFVLGSESFVKKLKEENAKVLTPEDHDMTCALEDVKLDKEISAIVVADDKRYNFKRIALATRYAIENKATFYCIGKDRGFPVGDSLIPGSWMLVTPVSTASFREPVVIGKPDVESVRRCLDFSKWQDVWVVGDNLETDIAFANAAGFKSVLVTTGVSSEGDVEESRFKPTAVVKSLSQACKVILG